VEIAASIIQLIEYFSGYFPLNKQEREEVAKLFKERRVKRRGLLLQQGDVCRHFTFVVSGCLKLYAVDRSGKEHNLQFAPENEWVFDISSFYAQRPSHVYIEAVESSVVLQIQHDDLLYLYINYQKFDRNFRIISERKYADLQDRMLHQISATAEERYLLFLETYPHLANRLPGTQVAAYLGITPEFLSKIRKDISGK
jgi:CRP-like cAMP-binding protein